MNAGDIVPHIKEAISYLKGIEKFVDPNACCVAGTSAGTASVPAGFASVSIAQVGAGNVVITMSDGSTYTMTTAGEVLVQSAPDGQSLPAYNISGTATWKWSAIK
jgi:hypothetical protein